MLKEAAAPDNWKNRQLGVAFPDLCAASLELVKQRTGLSFLRRMKWRMRSGFLLNVQGT